MLVTVRVHVVLFKARLHRRKCSIAITREGSLLITLLVNILELMLGRWCLRLLQTVLQVSVNVDKLVMRRRGVLIRLLTAKRQYHIAQVLQLATTTDVWRRLLVVH